MNTIEISALPRIYRAAVLVGAVLAGAACAPLPPVGSARAEWRGSPNFDARKPNFIIIHHTSDATVDEALRTLTDPARKVSAHYLIGRDGHLVQLVDERQRAWHAGESYWGGLTDLNSASIGIELDNTGNEPFAEAQIEALIRLLREVSVRHGIPPANVLGHGDVAPRRKVDPSALFPWARLAVAGFGLWCDAGAVPDGALPETLTGLQALGYDVSDPDAAVLAFKRHFFPEDATLPLQDTQRERLRCLLGLKGG